jgi:uncharacterized protein YecE (DUF72 family)
VSRFGLFGAERSPANDEKTRALAARLPRELRMGTSSWSFPGWRGIVWPDRAGWTDTELAREGLATYAQHPLFRTVGIDRSYYGPIPAHELQRWAGQLPDDFVAVAKVWEALTKPWVRGGPNPRYLDREAFAAEIVTPHLRGFARHTGALLLEIPAGESHHPDVFARDLHRFLADVRSPFPLAVEVRDRALLTDAFARALVTTGSSLCFTFHPTMPSLAEQVAWAERHGLLDASPSPLIARLMLPPGMSYETRRRACLPFDKLADVQEPMRRDVVDLVARAVLAGRTLFVLVNNKAEGSAPLTIRALAERLAAR